jgi:CheY-like chemotaxis protein
MMPEVDGFAVVERLRADSVTSEIPIVVLTSKSMTGEEKARLNGRISHLAEKGAFDRAGFVRLVRRLCRVWGSENPPRRWGAGGSRPSPPPTT